MSLEAELIAATAAVILAIASLGWFAYHRHERTYRKLEGIHEDMAGEMKTLHTRADREGAESIWALQGVRAAIEMLRAQVVALFRRDK